MAVLKDEKPIYWVGSSLKDLMSLPNEVKREAGYQLHRVQNSLEPDDWKPFQTVGAGVKEIRICEDGGAFRVMYVAKFAEKIYVLHAFQKKTQKTSSNDIDTAKARYKAIVNEEKSCIVLIHLLLISLQNRVIFLKIWGLVPKRPVN